MTDKKLTEEECVAALGGHCWDEGNFFASSMSVEGDALTRKCRHCWKRQEGHHPEGVIWEDAK